MTNTKHQVFWVDSSSPFDDSEKGNAYAKTTDKVVNEFVGSLFDKGGPYYRFIPSIKGTHTIALYDGSGNALMGDFLKTNVDNFKQYLLDIYGDSYPDLKEMLSHKSLLDAPLLGFSQKPLTEDTLRNSWGLLFSELLGDSVFAQDVIRDIYQKMIYAIAWKYDSFEIIHSLPGATTHEN